MGHRRIVSCLSSTAWLQATPHKDSYGVLFQVICWLMYYERIQQGTCQKRLRARKISLTNQLHLFQCMGKIFCVEFQRKPLKFHTKYLTHVLKDTIFKQCWKFKSSQIYEPVCLALVFEGIKWTGICILCLSVLDAHFDLNISSSLMIPISITTHMAIFVSYLIMVWSWFWLFSFVMCFRIMKVLKKITNAPHY